MSQISIVELSLVKSEKRFDAEFYKKEYLESETKITSQEFLPLIKLTEKIDVGFVGPMVHAYTENGVLLLQTRNIGEFFINLDSTISITEEFHKILKKSKVEYGDILIARSGSFGNASIYLEKEICNSSDIIIVRANEKINPFYLVAYLNSIFGRHQLYKFASGGLQGHVNLTILEKLKVPIVSVVFQKKIESLLLDSKSKVSDSVNKYKEAEQILLKELNLKDYKSEHNLSFQASINEIMSTKRFDADYYQPKYKKIEEKIKNSDYLKLRELFSIIRGVEVGSEAYKEEGVPFLRVSNLNKLDLDWSNPKFISEESFESFKNNFNPKIGEILLSKDATPGVAYLVRDNIRTIHSGGIIRLVRKKTIPHNKHLNVSYMTLVLNSIVVQQQMKRDSGGAIIVHWRPEEIRGTLIPILPKGTQDKIAEKLEESYKLRKESKELLEKAKKLVENEIEKEARTN